MFFMKHTLQMPFSHVIIIIIMGICFTLFLPWSTWPVTIVITKQIMSIYIGDGRQSCGVVYGSGQLD